MPLPHRFDESVSTFRLQISKLPVSQQRERSLVRERHRALKTSVPSQQLLLSRKVRRTKLRHIKHRRGRDVQTVFATRKTKTLADQFRERAAAAHALVELAGIFLAAARGAHERHDMFRA